MDMLREMAIYAQVVDEKGFSAAARKLGLTTSAVSRHVARLEAHLGSRLLQRTTRAITMTELGSRVYDICASVLAGAREVSALAGSYTEKPSGVLHVTAPVVLGETWLAPRLPGFLHRYPHVDVRVTLVDRLMDLIEEGVDVGVRIATDLAPGLAARPIAPLRYVLVASPHYIKEHGIPNQPEQLASHTCIYLGYGRFGNTMTLSSEGRQVEVSLISRMTINNSGAIVAAARASGGIGVVPDFSARDALADHTLIQVLPEWTIAAPYLGDIYAVHTPGRHIATKTRAFIDYLVETATAPTGQSMSAERW